jgi:signal transduction histidine kinase
LPDLNQLPPGLRELPSRTRLDPPGTSPKLEIGGEGYFATSVDSSSGPTLLILYPEAAWSRARWEASLPILALGILSLIPMAAVTGAVAHRLGVRLRTVEGKVAAIAGGDLRELDEQNRGDEVDDLIRSVNRMASQLRQMRETIRRTERAGVLAQLAAGLAHQLRNAATGARMAVQLHARRCQSPESDGSLAVALRQLALSEEQIKSLLTMGNSPGLVSNSLDIGGLIEEVVSLVEPTWKHFGVHFEQTFDRSIRLQGDGDRLRASLLNLIQNAIEAAGPGGNVAIVVVEEGEFVRFEVTDDGPGPPLELASTLFEPFVTGKPEGVGLGLSLAYRVAFDHGGGLSWKRVENRTIFTLKVARGPIVEPD